MLSSLNRGEKTGWLLWDNGDAISPVFNYQQRNFTVFYPPVHNTPPGSWF
jgi:hypothetical protein